MTEIPHVNHGSNWPEHEDYLVGNKAGLIELKNAISDSIEKGQVEIEIGEFMGIKCLETVFFENEPHNSTLLGNIFAGVVALLIAIIFIIGLKTIFSWFLYVT